MVVPVVSADGNGPRVRDARGKWRGATIHIQGVHPHVTKRVVRRRIIGPVVHNIECMIILWMVTGHDPGRPTQMGIEWLRLAVRRHAPDDTCEIMGYVQIAVRAEHHGLGRSLEIQFCIGGKGFDRIPRLQHGQAKGADVKAANQQNNEVQVRGLHNISLLWYPWSDLISISAIPAFRGSFRISTLIIAAFRSFRNPIFLLFAV